VTTICYRGGLGTIRRAAFVWVCVYVLLFFLEKKNIK
jgi:hypothetical protein